MQWAVGWEGERVDGYVFTERGGGGGGLATPRQTRHTESELNCWQRERLWGGAVTSGEVDVCAVDNQRMFAEQDVIIARLVLNI